MKCHFLLQRGENSLMLALGRGHAKCVRILLEGGAQANQQNKVSGYRPLYCLLVICTCILVIWP